MLKTISYLVLLVIIYALNFASGGLEHTSTDSALNSGGDELKNTPLSNGTYSDSGCPAGQFCNGCSSAEERKEGSQKILEALIPENSRLVKIKDKSYSSHRATIVLDSGYARKELKMHYSSDYQIYSKSLGIPGTLVEEKNKDIYDECDWVSKCDWIDIDRDRNPCGFHIRRTDRYQLPTGEDAKILLTRKDCISLGHINWEQEHTDGVRVESLYKVFIHPGLMANRKRLYKFLKYLKQQRDNGQLCQISPAFDKTLNDSRCFSRSDYHDLKKMLENREVVGVYDNYDGLDRLSKEDGIRLAKAFEEYFKANPGPDPEPVYLLALCKIFTKKGDEWVPDKINKQDFAVYEIELAYYKQLVESGEVPCVLHELGGAYKICKSSQLTPVEGSPGRFRYHD